MDIPGKINEIVSQRQNKLPIITKTKSSLHQINAIIQELDTVCEEAALGNSGKYKVLSEQYPELTTQLRVINTKPFHECYAKVNEVLNQLENRFSRQHIHISFVGRAGQGKSLVMQNISGLSNDVIPSSDGSDCTGAKSIITNVPGHDVSARITFYTRIEYMEIVNKYLREIFGEKKYVISSVEEINSLRQSDLKSQVDITSAQKQSLYLQLEKYILHTQDILPLLDTVRTVPAYSIESYVAQYSNADKSKKYYTYLGVKLAEILCSFPYSQCGRIVLIDTTGLGATALGIREQMLETVGNDSDAILLMTRPDARRPHIEQEDINIVTSTGEKVTAEYTRNMLFWILNKVSEGNGQNTQGIAEITAQLKNMPDFPVAKFIVSDCKDPEDVEQNILIPVLEQLSENLPRMDKILLRNAEKYLSALYNEYHAIAEKAGKAFSASIDEDTKRYFAPDIESTYNKMANSVRELYLNNPYGIQRDEDCEELKNAVHQKLLNVLACVPEKEKVLELLDNGFINQYNAYEKLTDMMRINIINDFLEINVTLNGLVKDMKELIVHCLADDNQGRLCYVVNASPGEPDIWLAEFISLLQEYPDYAPLKEAVQKLYDFDLSMENFLIYRIRASLDVIDISVGNQNPQLSSTLADKDALADDIIFWLEHNLETVYNNIRNNLKEFYKYPNSTLWAVVKDFYDRIVYSHDNQADAETAWRYLYEDYISHIWQNKYNSYKITKGVSESWNTFVHKIHQYNKESIFHFTD